MNARRLSLLLLPLLAGLLPAAALPATLPAAPGTALANAVLALERELYEQTPRTGTDVAIIVGLQIPDLRLRKLRLRIDDGPVSEYEYAEPEWESLAGGSLHLAYLDGLAPGTHRLRAELFARQIDASPSAPRATAHLDTPFEIHASPTILQLTMTRKRFGDPRLDLQAADPQTAAGGLRVRAARFWLESGRPWQAARLLSPGRFPGPATPADGEALALAVQRFAGLAPPTLRAERLARLNAVAATGTDAPGTLAALETLGTEPALTPADWALRDQANLQLGYAYLRAAQGKTALEAFARVRSPGPRGNAALLGFGWAFLVGHPAPQGAAVVPHLPAPRARFAATLADGRSEDGRKALERALVPWTELIGRDPLDLHAQEGLLALAWALDELGTQAQAHRYYERAAQQLETARAQLDRAREHIASGALAEAIAAGERDHASGWRTWLPDLPYASDTAYLSVLLADGTVAATVDAYRAARTLADAVTDLAARAAHADTSLQGRISQVRHDAHAAEHAARASLEHAAADALERHRRQITRYLAQARFALARHLDPDSHDDGAAS